MNTRLSEAPAPPRTEHPAVRTLVLAFTNDPVIRWIYPDAGRYLAHFPEVATLLGAAAFEAGTVDHTSDGSGAALWVPPNSPADPEAAGELLARSVAPERLEVMFAFLGQVDEFHPTTPHWYLPFIGVDPRHQGRGVGSALLRTALARVDGDGVGAYLEASSEGNRALYERHGFQVQGEIRVADSPPLWPMWRPAVSDGVR
ncbi:GNAT family N-acetyltransferase [Nocardioides limicola]|uniref:GNAT family N-acetyltransferase n=1 Tax=Nocardioides limicola TaxID=2803368 RepID=UPI00193B722E|nr:N-acetyltransferase [Nocardioides sp. DJM-14]